MESMTVTPFYEDIYLYDLNAARSLPLAHRSARGGQTQPDLLSLIKLPACEWHAVAAHLHEGAVYLSSNGGAVLLPVYGGIGRLVAVVKTNLSLPALAYVAQCAGQGAIYADAQIQGAMPSLPARECAAAESAVRTVARLKLLIDACAQVHDAFGAQECICEAASMMGVELMLPERAEMPPMKGQGLLPSMQHSGQATLACIMTLLSVMRNGAHARSGWLYAAPCEQGYTLQAFLRCSADADLSALEVLRGLLEDGGVTLGARTFASALKPPKQYAYMSRKITDPRKPLCVRCHCLDARCASCRAVQWAVLPFVCDAVLLGIKALPYFEE